MNRARSITRFALAALALALAIALSACAPTRIEPSVAPEVRLPVTGKAAPVVSIARQVAGVRYKWGGDSPDTGFDCSGLTWWTYKKVGVTLPRISTDQYAAGRPVKRADVRPGDLVFFRLPGAKGLHVGIATENGGFIHSPHEGGKVREERMDAPHWAMRYVGARRVLAAEA